LRCLRRGLLPAPGPSPRDSRFARRLGPCSPAGCWPLSLPPWAPWWIGAVGGLFATVIGKQVFGGLGQNLFNPAMVARVALLISFPAVMTAWVAPLPLGSRGAPGFIDGLRITLGGIPASFDAVASATLLGHAKTELSRGIDLLHSLAGGGAPSVGCRHPCRQPGRNREPADCRRRARADCAAHHHLAYPAGDAGRHRHPGAIGHAIDPARYLDVATHLLSGGAMLGAFFIATDYVTSPNTKTGQLLFGLGCGLLTWVIRTWGGYPGGRRPSPCC
jgi:electron transport complex protein RnfD